MAPDNRFGGMGTAEDGKGANVGYKTVEVNNRKMFNKLTYKFI